MGTLKLASWSGVLAASVVGLLTTSAPALECDADADCPKGFTCESDEAVACPDAPPCAEGEKCEEPADCVVETYSQCVSVDCSDDSDCASDMRCETIETTSCATEPSAGAAPNEPDGSASDSEDTGTEKPAVPVDPESTDNSCTTETRNYCVPKYLLECEVDADCGAGFSCAPTESCACSGSSGSAPSDGGGSDSADPAPDGIPAGAAGAASSGGEDPIEPDDTASEESSCVCEPGPPACKLDITECSADADCAAGFTCEDNPEGTCWASSDGESGCTTPDPAKICMPPYIDLYGGYGRDEQADSGSGPLGGVGSGEESPTAPKGEDDANADGDASDKSSDSGGCSIRPTSSETSFGWLGMALLAGLGMRRRRRS